MAPIWFPLVVDYAGRRCISFILPHTGFLPHTAVKWCDEALQADAERALFRTSQGLAPSGEPQERKRRTITETCCPMSPSSGNHCGLCSIASPSILLFQAALPLGIRVLPLEVSRGDRNGTGEKSNSSSSQHEK